MDGVALSRVETNTKLDNIMVMLRGGVSNQTGDGFVKETSQTVVVGANSGTVKTLKTVGKEKSSKPPF